MKKVFALFLGLILLPLAASATEYKEGVNYEVVKQTVTAKPEVREFFSYYCPHCFKFEPVMKALEEGLPKNVTLQKNPVDFLGKEMGPALRKAFAAAEILQVEEKFSNLVFTQLHVERKAINGEADILAIFKKAGVSKSEAQNALASFPVAGLASQMKRNTETFKIRGVPTIIVNGKYKVITGSVKNTEEFVSLVDYLSKKTK